MAGLLHNCTINTARAQQNASGGTNVPAPYLHSVAGHVSPLPAMAYKTLPEAALESEFVFTVEPNAQHVLPDIVYGDIVLAILLKDGKTYWPGFNPNETFHIVYTMTTTPGLLYVLKAYIARETGGGIVY